MCANPTMINRFFDQYESLLKKLNIDSPRQIWNCNESGCPDVPKEREVVGETGIPASQIVAKEQGENTTVLTFANAMGEVVPPIVIHKGSRVADAWTLDAPVGVMVFASQKGWINRKIFLEYVTRWVHWMKSHKYLDRPHILLLDSHKLHVYNIQFIKLMLEFNIHVLAIPPHTSHLTQPLDDAPFANLKAEWNANLIEYMFHNVSCGMPKSDFFYVFWPAWRKAMTVSNVQAGFRETGIFPVNRNKIHPALLGPSQPTDNLANGPGKKKFNKLLHFSFC